MTARSFVHPGGVWDIASHNEPAGGSAGRAPGRSMLVKKYTNRRLYDTADSRYITLEELAEKIRAGEDATVVDAKTGEDLTQATLTQIIMESRGAARILPVPLLVQLIRLGDEALAEFMGLYLGQALDGYLTLKRGAQALTPINPLATLPFAATNALARLLLGSLVDAGAAGAPQHAPPAPSPAPPAPSKALPPAETEMATLRRELDELKREVHRKKR